MPTNPSPTSRILLVDDERDIRETLQVYLQQRLPGADVRVAADGQDALRQLESFPADLIVSDFRMPGLDGLAFLAQARRAVPKAAQILITAYPDVQLAMRALNEAHVAYFLTKPLDPKNLVDSIQKSLAGRASATVADARASVRSDPRTDAQKGGAEARADAGADPSARAP